MFKHILIPLDGSKLAESVLPAAVYLSHKLNSSITLFHVIEKNAPSAVHGETHLKVPETANEYLKEIVKKYFSILESIDHHVHITEVQNVAKSIFEHAKEFECDLILMCSHGRGGLQNLLFGNIAQHVIAFGETPVLLIHPLKDKATVDFSCNSILLPLDGIPEHEEGLQVGKDLAKNFKSGLNLLTVIPTYNTLFKQWTPTSKLLPGTTSQMLEIAEQDAEDYLNELAKEGSELKIEMKIHIGRGEPSGIILDFCKEHNVDIVILSTHKKSGMKAFWDGSVAPKVCSYARVPVLLIPIKN